jgi:predicted ester cyclase
MSEQESNKDALRQLLAAVDRGDLDGALDFYSPEYVDHDASEGRSQSADATNNLRTAFRMFAAAFSDTRHVIEDLVAEGDRVVARISVQSRHTGEMFGVPPTGNTVRNDSIVIYRFEGGRIRERWCRERTSTRALLQATREPPVT